MPYVHTPATANGSFPPAGSVAPTYTSHPIYINGVDMLQVLYTSNFNGTATVDQEAQRLAILAVIELAFKNATFLDRIQAIAAAADSAADFVSDLNAALAA